MWQRKECGCVFTDVGVKMIIKFLLFFNKEFETTNTNECTEI